MATDLMFMTFPWQGTNRTGTLLLETGGTRNEGEDLSGQTDEECAIGQAVAL
jgi:hypothetical protein